MKEIKKLEIGSSSDMGGVYCYINLNDYADKNSIKCNIVDFNETIIPEKFAFDGTPYFKYDVYKKHSKDNPFAITYVEVEYQPKQLELEECIFNSAKGIEKFIVDLNTLNFIINTRIVAKYKKNIELREFVWHGILKFDKFGQVLLISDKKFPDSTNILESDTYQTYIYSGAKEIFENKFKNETVLSDYFNSYFKNYRLAFADIPEEEDFCPQCNKRWTLDNMLDYIRIEESENKIVGYHKDCVKFHHYEKQLTEFQNLFSNIYNLNDLKFRGTPNECCPCDYCPPWFIVSTPDGDIKIGWRKHVINIQWLNNYKQFREDFVGENVTKNLSDRYIHADGIKKAIEYIRRAKNSTI